MSRMLSDLERPRLCWKDPSAALSACVCWVRPKRYNSLATSSTVEEWAGRDQLRADTGVDRQIVNSPVGWHSELLLDPSISDLMIDGTTGVCAQQLRIAWLKV